MMEHPMVNLNDKLAGLPDEDRDRVRRAAETAYSLTIHLKHIVAEVEAATKQLDAERADGLMREATGQMEAWSVSVGIVRLFLPDFGDGLVADIRRAAALVDCLLVQVAAGVPAALMRFVADIDRDRYPEHWEGIDRTCRGIAAEQPDGYRCDAEHLAAYIRMLVAHEAVQSPDQPDPVPDEAVASLRAAIDRFFDMYVRPDYARGVTDVKDRIMHGLRDRGEVSEQQADAFVRDVEAFREAAARHEYADRDVYDVVAALRAMDERVRAKLAHRGPTATAELIAALERVARRQRTGTVAVHLEALEQQWRAYRYNSRIVGAAERAGMADVGALQHATCTALRRASAYCWFTMPVEAVASAAASLPDHTTMSDAALGDLADTGTCGWWWFEEPLPIKTLAASGTDQPVVALLWERELAPSGPRVWFNTFVMEDKFSAHGAFGCTFATPTASWIWRDGQTLCDLPRELAEGYHQLELRGLRGYGAATGLQPTVDASVWFSRFFYAAASWLRQRIAGTTRGPQQRQVSRRLQREYRLDDPPKVEIVHLRRREMVTRVEGPGAGREYTCRFVVHGHWRNQYYPSRGQHAQKWIESYIKGPDDAPLKEATRVYAVMR